MPSFRAVVGKKYTLQGTMLYLASGTKKHLKLATHTLKYIKKFQFNDLHPHWEEKEETNGRERTDYQEGEDVCMNLYSTNTKWNRKKWVSEDFIQSYITKLSLLTKKDLNDIINECVFIYGHK